MTTYNGKYLVYATVQNGNWNGFFSQFDSFDEWATADQSFHEGHVAPQVFHFTPKDTWLLVTQWPIRYRTSKTPDDFNSWSPLQSLMTGDPTGGRGVGPIDPAVICDDTIDEVEDVAKACWDLGVAINFSVVHDRGRLTKRSERFLERVRWLKDHKQQGRPISTPFYLIDYYERALERWEAKVRALGLEPDEARARLT